MDDLLRKHGGRLDSIEDKLRLWDSRFKSLQKDQDQLFKIKEDIKECNRNIIIVEDKVDKLKTIVSNTEEKVGKLGQKKKKNSLRTKNQFLKNLKLM